MEIVSEYPRPPLLVPCQDQILVKAGGALICETTTSFRVLETFHPPTYYLPPDSFRLDLLQPAVGASFCEWKGVARYFDLVVPAPGDEPEHRLRKVVWQYPQPSAAFAAIAGWLALYPGAMDGCWVNGEAVIAQPGGFYGGWITSQVEGPFKGDPLHPELR